MDLTTQHTELSHLTLYLDALEFDVIPETVLALTGDSDDSLPELELLSAMAIGRSDALQDPSLL